jgi:hypothetical protein
VSDWFIDHIGGPLTRKDWFYITFIVVLSITMGMLVPLLMEIV